MQRMIPVLFAAACGWLATAPATAQEALIACSSQQALEQHLASAGQLDPDECRSATVVRIASQAGTLCAIDLSQEDAGVVGRIQEVAAPTQWWVPCDELEASLSVGEA